MKPNNFPNRITEGAFIWIQAETVLPQTLKQIQQIFYMPFFSLGFRNHIINIYTTSADECFSQIIKSMDIGAIQTHIPLQRNTGQTILKKVNQQTLIISMGRHSPHVHYQVSTRASVTLIFLKFRDLELDRYLNIRDQT